MFTVLLLVVFFRRNLDSFLPLTTGCVVQLYRFVLSFHVVISLKIQSNCCCFEKYGSILVAVKYWNGCRVDKIYRPMSSYHWCSHRGESTPIQLNVHSFGGTVVVIPQRGIISLLLPVPVLVRRLDIWHIWYGATGKLCMFVFSL